MRRLRCEKAHTKEGGWTQQEDARLIAHIRAHGEGGWRSLPKAAGLLRCGKSCRLRWINYLRPNLERGNFSDEEDDLIIKLHNLLGDKWSLIAGRLPGRTDNEIKNYWDTHIKKRKLSRKLDSQTNCSLWLPDNGSTTLSSPLAEDHEISALQSLRTAEVRDFFQQDQSESSPTVPAAFKNEEHGDLNLDLCMNLRSNSFGPENRASSVDTTRFKF